MAKPMEIPQDIVDIVIAEVGDDISSLKQCALVSSSFLHPSRKQLFSRIVLRSDQNSQGFHQLLVRNPLIQSFIKSITIFGDGSRSVNPKWMNGTSLVAILRLPFCCLERFSIVMCPDYWNMIPWNWNSFSSELKDALSNIIYSSNIKTLSLEGINKLPNTFFLHVVHLPTLELHFLSPNDFGYESSSSLTSMGVIDRCVWHLRKNDVRGSTEPNFLPFVCRSRFFEINVILSSGTMRDFDILSSLMGSLRISLTSPATLEHLKFNISFRGDSNEFDFYEFYEDLRDADVWTHLDSIATDPTGSQLQRVDININYSFRYDDDGEETDEDEVLDAVLDSLPLLRMKGILFVAAAFLGRYPGWMTETSQHSI